MRDQVRLLAYVREQLERPHARLNLHELAAWMGRTRPELMVMLSRSRERGLFHSTAEAPYFRLTTRGLMLLARHVRPAPPGPAGWRLPVADS